jgi:hypothetical protein
MARGNGIQRFHVHYFDWGYDALNLVESSASVGKNFPLTCGRQSTVPMVPAVRLGEACSKRFSRSNSSNRFEDEDFSSTATLAGVGIGSGLYN